MKKLITILCIAAMCLGVAVFSGCGKKEEDVKVLKLAHGLDVTHPVHKAMVFMAEKVKEKSGGRLRVDIYPSEQLGNERECIEQLQMGALAITKCSTAPLESFVPIMKVLAIPYLFRDSDHYWNTLLGPIGKELLAAGEPVGLKGLCFYDAGARSFYTTKRLVNTPADLKGLKIRVQQSPMAIEMIQAMGASATPIAWGELYTSLQQGVVDGAENNPPSFDTSMHYEICKYYILDEHTRLPDVLLASTAIWSKLSPEFQKILQEAADESVTYQRKLWAEKEKESMEKVKSAGVTIIRPDKKPFRDAAQSMWKKYEGKEIGKLTKKIQEIK